MPLPSGLKFLLGPEEMVMGQGLILGGRCSAVSHAPGVSRALGLLECIGREREDGVERRL